jgi:uncharacterized protein (DUF39 family)
VSWTYSGDPTSSDRDELRFLVQDTDSDLPLLQDEELDYLISRWMPRYDSLIYVGAVAAAIISRKFAGVVNVSADGVSVNVADVSDRYATIAAALRAEYKEAQESGEVDISKIMYGATLEPDIAPLVFGIALHDNIEAGQQSYGGEVPVVLEWPADGGLATG